jgi:hypothetical protein
MITIIINKANTDEFEVKMHQNETISDLKEKIANHTKTEVSKQRLLSHGIQLDNSQTFD